MREVVSLSSSKPGQAVVVGPMFWLNEVPPAGFEPYEIKTYLQMDTQTKADASQYLASLVNQTVELATGAKFNERSMYALPLTKHTDGGEMEARARTLMLLLRGSGPTDQATDVKEGETKGGAFWWASSWAPSRVCC